MRGAVIDTHHTRAPQQGELRSAVNDLQQKMKRERGKASDLKAALGWNDCGLRQVIEVSRLRGRSAYLSARGLRNVRMEEEGHKVRSVVGSRSYEYHSSLAESISPPVLRLCFIGGTIDKLGVDVANVHEFFERFLDVGDRDSISVDSSNRATFMSICGPLGNLELSESERRQQQVESH
jgi:hypothetical protein